jgi:hypothetical protein
MLKRIGMLVMAVVLGLFLTGCGDADLGSPAPDDGVTNTDNMTDTGTDTNDDGGGIDY